MAWKTDWCYFVWWSSARVRGWCLSYYWLWESFTDDKSRRKNRNETTRYRNVRERRCWHAKRMDASQQALQLTEANHAAKDEFKSDLPQIQQPTWKAATYPKPKIQPWWLGRCCYNLEFTSTSRCLSNLGWNQTWAGEPFSGRDFQKQFETIIEGYEKRSAEVEDTNWRYYF